MATTPECPRCRKPLAPEDIERSLRCEECGGVFMPAESLRPGMLEGAVPRATGAPMPCPRCEEPMRALELGSAEIDRCDACHGAWLGAGKQLAGKGGLGRLLVFGLTLPERTLRSAVGLGAGAIKEMAELIVPRAFQDARTYRTIIRNSLKFLTEDVGGVAGAPGSSELPRDYVARKAVGNFLDLAGLATLHVSPLWILALVSDVAHGTGVYVRELASELKAKGLIDPTSAIHGVDDILDAVGKASGSTASLFDTPPLSLDQLRETVRQVRAAAVSADLAAALPATELRRLWDEMREFAGREDLSLLELSAGITMRGLERLKAVSSGTLTGLHVAGGILDRHVLGHYSETLREIRERGFFRTLGESCAPYAEAIWRNFGEGRVTLTEEVLSGRLTGRAFRKLAAWLRKPLRQEGAGEGGARGP